MSTEEIAKYIAEHGCFCGGDGKYADYNCGISIQIECPHCRGTGSKRCSCVELSLSCKS